MKRSGRKYPQNYVKASSDYEYDDEEMDGISLGEAYDDYNFYTIEENAARELGVYLDFSSIRSGYGPIGIYADPDQENNADVWLGDESALITAIDYPEYESYIESNILWKPQDEWQSLYTQYLKSLL